MNMAQQIETPQQAARRLAAKAIADGFKPEALHEYTDEMGAVLYWRIRLKHPNFASLSQEKQDQYKNSDKWIRPMKFADHKYLIGEPPFDIGKPLYKLNELAQRLDALTFICEGEKCADALIKIGTLATTSGGADSADKADWQPLAQRNVIIWPDNDEAGKRYGETVANKLRLLNCVVKIIDVSALNLLPKCDAADWLVLNPNATKEDVLALPTVDANASTKSVQDTSLSASDGETLPQVEPLPACDSEANLKPYFRLNKSGVYHIGINDKGEPLPPLWICSALHVRAETRNQRGHAWGRLLEWQDKDQRWHHWALPMEMLKGDCADVRGRLLHDGLQISPTQKARNQLAAYIMTQAPEQTERMLCVDRTGWHSGAFVLPDHVFGANAANIVYQTESDHDCGLAVSGTVDEWRNNVARLCTGNSRHVFAISCAFAPPLLHLVGLESGGFHLRGPSSGGKSTAQKAAASVWGNPEQFKKSWRTTDNALEGVAAAHNDLLLLLDEIKQVDEKRVGEIAYMLGNGEGKGRSTKDGGNRKRSRWHLLYLSSGELSLSDMMRDAGKRTYAGQEVRLVDITADAGEGFGTFETLHEFSSAKDLADNLNTNSMAFHGAAGIAFLEAITKDPQAVTVDAKTMMEDFLSEALPKDASAQIKRVCSRFALVAVAGELATVIGITGWQTGEAERACKKCFGAWLDTFGHDDKEATEILDQVRGFIEAHGESRFQLRTGTDQRTIFNRVGFKEADAFGNWTYLILPEAMRLEVCRGLNLKQACTALVKAGWLALDNQGKNSISTALPGMGKKRVYTLRADRMES